MNNMCTDVGFASANKYGEQICGDHVETVAAADGSTVVVLADGLGSGVKAGILSILTAKLISTMMANSLSLEDCVSSIAATLPICRERHLAYSTFTSIRISDSLDAEIIQYDNPRAILLRGGRSIDYPVTSETIGDKTVGISKLRLAEGDAVVAVSDGVIYAGAGLKLNFGWQRDDVIRFLEARCGPGLAAKTLSSTLLAECCRLYEQRPGDDTTVCTVKVRRRSPVNLLIGPPLDPADVPKMMSLFFSKRGKHIVCGGTTSSLAAEFLHRPLETGAPVCLDPDIPPTAKIEGVDLVTEGMLTITRVLEYAKDFLGGNLLCGCRSQSKDGASLIAGVLFEEATDINFYVGRAVNPAHRNPDLPVSLSAKTHLVDELSDCLKKMGKNIKVSYF